MRGGPDGLRRTGEGGPAGRGEGGHHGLRGTPRAAENLRRWSDLLPALTPVALRHGDAELAADLRVLLRARGRQLALADALIAAVALRLDLTLLTRDRDFVAVPGLASEDWSTPQNDSPTRSP